MEDPPAWTNRLIEVLPRVRRFAKHLSIDTATADDLVQEAMVTALRRAEDYDEQRPLDAWLNGIIVRHHYRLRRQAYRRRQVRNNDMQVAPSSAQVAIATEDLRFAWACIRDLPQPYRDIVILRLIDGWSISRIAKKKNRKHSTISTQLGRGLRMLRIKADRFRTVS